jgi:hypothetical protein
VNTQRIDETLKKNGDQFKKRQTTYTETKLGSFVDDTISCCLARHESTMSREELIKYGYKKI